MQLLHKFAGGQVIVRVQVEAGVCPESSRGCKGERTGKRTVGRIGGNWGASIVLAMAR